MSRPSFNSDTYPYSRLNPGANRLDGADRIPLQIIRYLLDLPDANGYMPVDDNSRPRVRLAKLLWNDGANPLAGPLPTPSEKLSLLFDGDRPDINTGEEKKLHPKGYRIFPQVYWYPAELDAKVVLKSYIGRIYSQTPFHSTIGLTFEILVNAMTENTTRSDAYSRAFSVETAIVSALSGVNITGIGPISIARRDHMDNGSSSLHDNGTHVGRILHMSIDWAEGGDGCSTIEGCT